MKFMCIDETYNDKFTVLCGVVFNDYYWPIIEKEILSLKTKFFSSFEPYSFELKSYEIRQGKGVYRNLPRETLSTLQREIGELINKLDIRIISAIIDEQPLKGTRWKSEPPYHLAYKFLMERFEMMLTSDRQHGIILIDNQANKMGRNRNNTDRKLKDVHHYFRINGTEYVKFNRLIKGLHVVDSMDSLGVQLADLCVYPILRYFSGDEEYYPWKIVRDKIHCSKDGRIEGYGLKLFP